MIRSTKTDYAPGPLKYDRKLPTDMAIQETAISKSAAATKRC